jgi:uncharacterized protein YprB with RNaseH-like and TPR domain
MTARGIGGGADDGSADGPADRSARQTGSDSAGEIRRKIEALRLIMAAGLDRPSGEGRHHNAPERGEFSVRAGARIDGSFEDSREVSFQDGKCLRIEKAVSGLGGMEHLTPGSLSDALARITGSGGTRIVFLDLETTGLSATPLFLAGTLMVEPDRLTAVQLLARDYSEERCLIGLLDNLLAEFDLCITFNGKSFDLPYLRDRAKYHRLGLRSSPEQLDLLHHARRRWKHALPDCRLLTLEWHILGRRRFGDVDGWIVPCIYHEFVHTGDARRLKQVLRHNLMDVLSMAELLISLSET